MHNARQSKDSFNKDSKAKIPATFAGIFVYNKKAIFGIVIHQIPNNRLLLVVTCTVHDGALR